MWENQYFQMDIYKEPCHPRSEGLILLESYTTLKGFNVIFTFLHKFLKALLSLKGLLYKFGHFARFERTFLMHVM